MNKSLRESLKKHLPFLARTVRAGVNFSRAQTSKRTIASLLKSGKDILVEVGAGDKPGSNGWLTIDMTKNCDIFRDLRKGLPFPDGRVKRIYSSHFFEHLSFHETQLFLAECRRVLAPGGEFSICVPNARLYLEAYIHGVTLDPGTHAFYAPALNHTTAIDYANYVGYMAGEHKYMFDQENLLFILNAAGFKNARKRGFDPEVDLKGRDFESIYAVAEN